MGSKAIKTRFCPSPTGLMHLGNTRTALFSALYAYHKTGTFLLRIEDTDETRSDEKYTDALMADLQWLGLKWQEGPNSDGGTGPYWQSARQGIYDEYYEKLIDAGVAYPCFCSEEQLKLSRKVQRAAGQPPRYPGTCRGLSPEEIKEKEAEGIKPTLRFHVPPDADILFDDMVHGEQRFFGHDIGDFIIRRADGTPPFMYCNAVDDALMGVTHVLRGDDHLTNTPRQILILQTLKLPIPRYGHISLIVGPDGSPLSKRHGSRSVQALRDMGYLPNGLINYLARLGHYFENPGFMTLEELAAGFSHNNLNKAPAKFDLNQLHHWQKEALQHLSDDAVWQWMEPAVADLVPEDEKEQFVQMIRGNINFPNDAADWARRLFCGELSLGDDEIAIIKSAGPKFFDTVLQSVTKGNVDYKLICNELKEHCQVKGKQLFQPLRIASTGTLQGPELGAVFSLLGQARLETRFKEALQIAAS